MRAFALACAAAACFAAVGADTLFKGGRWKELVYDKPSREPIVFGGESRSEAACAPDYCIYLDIWYDDGTPVWGVRAEWNQGTHDWERTAGAFVPKKPIKKIQMFAFLRKGTGKAQFRNLWLERRNGRGDVLGVSRRTGRPYVTSDQLTLELFIGRTIERKVIDLPGQSSFPVEACPVTGLRVWTADSMRKVTPLTFPGADDLASVSLDVALDERESAQVNITAGRDCELADAKLVLPKLKNSRGETLKGDFTWQRVGYVAREPGYFPHPCGVPEVEKWLPDPLLPAAPMRVRRASTQGAWITVHPARNAVPGEYRGDLLVTAGGKTIASVPVTVLVQPFAQPKTFGMPTAFCVMDGFTRRQYPDSYEKMRRESWEVMLDHRLNPDDISRTSPPPIADLLHARERGMNRFNILNIVPPPKDPKALWVCYTPPSATEDPAFYPAFKARLDPYVAELRRHGLEKFAYLYGFDERQKEYYKGIDELWRKLRRDFPDIPVMTTAMMYKDMAKNPTNPPPYTLTTDWYCPLTSVYNPDLSAKLRAKGKQVWWYTCCGPTYPYANMASLEYPTIEGRILGWMTHLYRADGLLFWHVNFWHGNPCLDEDDTFLPGWHTRSGLHMPGDGIFLYPGKKHVLPSIRLAQVRDAVEDYERLQLAAEKAGAEAADAVSRTLIESMTKYTRDPAALRAARARLAELINGRQAACGTWGKWLDAPADYASFPRRVERISVRHFDGFDVETYRQANGPGTTQRVMLAVPTGVRGKLPAVAVPFYFPEAMLGFNPETGGLDSPLVETKTNLTCYAEVAYMRDLVRRGYVVASADSYHLTYDPAHAPAGFAKWRHAGEKLRKDHPAWTGVGKLVFDTRLMIDLLASDPRVDAGRIGITGHSLGGKMAFYTGCLDPRVRVIVASDFGFGWEQTNWSDPWYWGDTLKDVRAAGLDHSDLLSLSGGKPFCLIAGKYDDATSGAAMRRARGYEGHPERLKLVNHASGHRPPRAATEEGYRFLDSYLKK